MSEQLTPVSTGTWGAVQEYLVALWRLCSELTSLRLQQFTVGNVQRLPEFLACQEVKHEQSASQLDSFGDMAVGAVTAACHAALEHLEAHLSQLHPDQACTAFTSPGVVQLTMC